MIYTKNPDSTWGPRDLHSNRASKALAGRRGQSRRGGVLVELALTLGILLTLTFGSIEFTYCFFVKNALTNAATQRGWAAIPANATNAQVQSAVDAQMAAAKLSNIGYTVTTTPTDITTASTGSMITIQVSCNWGTAGNGFRPLALISASKTISGSCAMRKESG